MLAVLKDDKTITIEFSDILEIVEYQLDDSVYKNIWTYDISYILATLFHDNLQAFTFDELNKIALGGYDMTIYCDDYIRAVSDPDVDFQSLIPVANEESVKDITDLLGVLYTMFESLAVAVCTDIVYLCIE